MKKLLLITLILSGCNNATYLDEQIIQNSQLHGKLHYENCLLKLGYLHNVDLTRVDSLWIATINH